MEHAARIESGVKVYGRDDTAVTALDGVTVDFRSEFSEPTEENFHDKTISLTRRSEG